jgi:hypothetical protein
MTAHQYLQTQKALLHTRTLLTGSGIEELAAFMVAAYHLAQAECRYVDANKLLNAVAELYAQDGV